MLHGTIPATWASLGSLFSFDVSNNNLRQDLKTSFVATQPTTLFPMMQNNCWICPNPTWCDGPGGVCDPCCTYQSDR